MHLGGSRPSGRRTATTFAFRAGIRGIAQGSLLSFPDGCDPPDGGPGELAEMVRAGPRMITFWNRDRSVRTMRFRRVAQAGCRPNLEEPERPLARRFTFRGVQTRGAELAGWENRSNTFFSAARPRFHGRPKTGVAGGPGRWYLDLQGKGPWSEKSPRLGVIATHPAPVRWPSFFLCAKGLHAELGLRPIQGGPLPRPPADPGRPPSFDLRSEPAPLACATCQPTPRPSGKILESLFGRQQPTWACPSGERSRKRRGRSVAKRYAPASGAVAETPGTGPRGSSRSTRKALPRESIAGLVKSPAPPFARRSRHGGRQQTA